MAAATFAMGCFWGPEAMFRRIAGVTDVAVGYTGGHLENPTYEQVCHGDTGHAEAVRVEFDPAVVSYAELLEAFWTHHDPTTRNRQGPDIGHQYRSAVFVHDESQREAALASREARQAALSSPVVTDIEAVAEFYTAEDYHQRYLEKHGAVC